MVRLPLCSLSDPETASRSPARTPSREHTGGARGFDPRCVLFCLSPGLRSVSHWSDVEGGSKPSRLTARCAEAFRIASDCAKAAAAAACSLVACKPGRVGSGSCHHCQLRVIFRVPRGLLSAAPGLRRSCRTTHTRGVRCWDFPVDLSANRAWLGRTGASVLGCFPSENWRPDHRTLGPKPLSTFPPPDRF